MVQLHNGILRSSKKEATLTFCNSMDGPGENHAKWNKPFSERKNTIWFHLYVESTEYNKLTNQTGTEA